MAFTNLLFLSHGIQLGLFFLLIGLILVFMKMTSLEHRIRNIEDHMNKYVTTEDYMETFNNMLDAKLDGKSTSPFSESQASSSSLSS
jgi:ABC-type lipoprotein release transport system permease subunit